MGHIIKTLICGLDQQQFVAQDINVQKKPINLIISLEPKCTESLKDCLENINWKIEGLENIANYKPIFEKYQEFDIKTLALAHHGNQYCQYKTEEQQKLIWSTSFYKYENLINMDESIRSQFYKLKENDKQEGKEFKKWRDIKWQDSEEFENIKDSDYIFLLEQEFINVKKCELNQQRKNFISLYIYLKKMISSIIEDGTYLSIACDEADDNEFLPMLAKLTNKNIKLYAHRKLVTLNFNKKIPGGKYKSKQYTTIFNVPLSTTWGNDNKGWVYYDKNTQTLNPTEKDLRLNSTGKDCFSLIKGGMDNEKRLKIATYYSAVYKKYYIEYYGESGYVKWKKNEKELIWGK